MTALVHLKYGYDRSSNRTYRRDEQARTSGAGFDQLYGYDGLHRLTSMEQGMLGIGNSVISGPTLTQNWSLDQTGNWSGYQQGVTGTLNQTRTHNTVNEITGIGETVGLPWIDPAHDANGNMTTIPQPEQLDEGYTATYDAWNRLVKLQEDDGAGGLQTVAEYQYDGLGRRTVKKTYSAGVLNETRHAYFSDQWQVLEERVDSSTTADQQYVWGQRYIDDLVLRDTPSERLYALQDALFNVVALVDDAGVVKERFAYQPYGQSEELDPDFTPYSGTDYQWAYRFTGRELDLESGLQINRNRYLHLQLGRWITRDPIGYEDGVNLQQAPSTATGLDPSGLYQIEAQVDAFIPFAWVFVDPYSDLKGDNRGSSQVPLGPAFSRAFQRATAEVEECVSKDPLVFQTSTISISTMRTLPPGAHYYRILQRMGTIRASIKATRTGPCSIDLRFKMHGVVPWLFAPGAPAIDWDITYSIHAFELIGTGMAISWKLKGFHDGFPAYEMYLQRELIHSHDPVAKGQWVTSLFPPMEWEVNKSSIMFRRGTASCCECRGDILDQAESIHEWESP